MNIVTVASYLPFLNAVLFGLYYALLQENYGALSLTTVLFVNGVLFVVTAAMMAFGGMGEINFTALKSTSLLKVFIAVLLLSTFLHVTHYLAMKHTSATYMAFAELGYPLFVPLFAYYLFGRTELSPSIVLGGMMILIGSVIIALGGVKAA